MVENSRLPYCSFETTARVRPSTMRFLCVCVAVLSGMVAVGRCFVSTPEPMKAAANILRGVLANDREWYLILTQELNLKEVDFDGKLAELGLTPKPGAGVVPYTIVHRLVTRKSTTGTQLMYGIRVLGIALVNQFVTTLMAHTFLAYKFAEFRDADPAALRVAISTIQVALANFASKAASFGHEIDFFKQLSDDINVFFRENEAMLDSKKINMKYDVRLIIMDFLSKLLRATKEKIMRVSYGYKGLGNEEVIEIMRSLNIRPELPEVIDKNMNSIDLYKMIRAIDDYEQVNVKSVELDFVKKRFNIIEYLPSDDMSQKLKAD